MIAVFGVTVIPPNPAAGRSFQHWLASMSGTLQQRYYDIQPVPKAYRKCCVKCKVKGSHLILTQRML